MAQLLAALAALPEFTSWGPHWVAGSQPPVTPLQWLRCGLPAFAGIDTCVRNDFFSIMGTEAQQGPIFPELPFNPSH